MASQHPGTFRASIGKYRILSRLGKGGMGEVYKAHDPSLDRIVALKTIRTDVAQAGSLDRFYKEGRASGRLRHPLIVTVYELGQDDDDTVFLAMEYLEGQSLASALAAGVLRFEMKIRILILVLDALEYAHRQGVIHRDIKPSNVQLLPDGSIKLLDFGVARILTAEEMTRTGSVVGTPYYMAPEQLMGKKIDHRADVYSTGAMAYELLTERRAFDGESLTEVIVKVMSQPPDPMDNAWSRAFPEAERIVTKAMQKAPEWRYASAREMAADLRGFLQAHLPSILRVEEELSRPADGPVRTGPPRPMDPQATEILGGGRPVAPEVDATEKIVQQGGEPLSHTWLAPWSRGEVAGLSSDRDEATEVVPVPSSGLGGPGPLQPAGGVTRVGRKLALPALLLLSLAVLAAAGLIVWRGANLGAFLTAANPVGSQARQGPSAEAARRDSDALTLGPSRAKTPPPRGDLQGVQGAGVSGQRTDTPPASPNGTPLLEGSQGTELRDGDGRLGRSARPGGGVFLQASAAGATNRELVVLLAEALRARGCVVRGEPSPVGATARVRGEIALRPSPFAGVSATTADYVGVLEIQRGGGQPRRFDFDGHTMEFGDHVVRAAALKELAGKMAERIQQLAGPAPR